MLTPALRPLLFLSHLRRRLRVVSAIALLGCAIVACSSEESSSSQSGELNSTCEAMPLCEQGEVTSDTQAGCLQDVACREVKRCGRSIWCSDVGLATCLALPTCDKGEEPAASESECLQDAPCRKVEMCGKSLWCSQI